jgi:chromosome segregation ATPase
MATNNVSMLSRIFGYQDFDAVEFSRWSETADGRRKQIAVVKSLLAPEIRERIEEIDKEVSGLKTERTGINRDVKTFAGFVETMERQLEPGDIERYAKPVDVTELMEKQRTNAALIEKAKTVRAALEQRTEQLKAIPERERKIDEDLAAKKAELEARVEEARIAYEEALAQAKTDRENLKKEKADLETRKSNAEEWLRKYEENNPEKTDVPQLLEQAEAHNKKHSLVEQYMEKKQQYDAVTAKAGEMDEKIDSLGKERADLISSAELPM